MQFGGPKTEQDRFEFWLPPPLQGITNGTGLAVYTAEALLEDTRHRLKADPDAVLLLLSLQGITNGTGLMVHTEALDVERCTRIKAGLDAVRMLSLQGITNGTGLAVYTAEALLRNFLLTANSLFAPAGADAAAYRTTATFVMFVRIFPQLPVLSPNMFSEAQPREDMCPPPVGSVCSHSTSCPSRRRFSRLLACHDDGLRLAPAGGGPGDHGHAQQQPAAAGHRRPPGLHQLLHRLLASHGAADCRRNALSACTWMDPRPVCYV